MTTQIVVRPEAEAEIREAFTWYEQVVPGLGNRFLNRLDILFHRISENAAQFPKTSGFRRVVVQSFPHCIYFLESHDAVVVVAVLHGKRNPKRLLGRS